MSYEGQKGIGEIENRKFGRYRCLKLFKYGAIETDIELTEN